MSKNKVGTIFLPPRYHCYLTAYLSEVFFTYINNYFFTKVYMLLCNLGCGWDFFVAFRFIFVFS